MIIYLDAGHGGIVNGEYTTAPLKMAKLTESGYHGDGYFYEGVSNRIIMNKVKTLLHGYKDIEIVVVSEEHKDNSLRSRVMRANSHYKASSNENALYISFHSNSANGQARGFEVFSYFGQTNSDIFADNIFKEMQYAFKNDIKFRSDISDGDLDKEANFYVIKKTRMPAILIENLFFDNINDADLLMDDIFTDKVALATVKSIIKGACEAYDLNIISKQIGYSCSYIERFVVADGIQRISPNKDNEIKYNVSNSDDLPIDVTREIIGKVFKEIEQYLGSVKFVYEKSFANADIKLLFAPQNQNIIFTDEIGQKFDIDSPYSFDGQFGTLAVGFLPLGNVFEGVLLFDMAEKWSLNHNWMDNSIDLFSVALHEVLHVLGLRHTQFKDAVMHRIYDREKRSLHQDDISGLQAIYYDYLPVKDKYQPETKSEDLPSTKKSEVNNKNVNVIEKSFWSKLCDFFNKLFY